MPQQNSNSTNDVQWKVCLLKQSQVLLLVLVYPSRSFLYYWKLKFLVFLSFPFYETI